MIIREYRKTDIEQICSLHKQTVKEVNNKDHSPELIEHWTRGTVEGWKGSLQTSICCYVAEIDGRIAGFGDLINGEIKRLYVHKNYIRKIGVGTALLKTLEETARKMGWQKIEVDATITAVEFYKKQGYDDHGEATHELRGIKFPVHKMSKKFQ